MAISTNRVRNVVMFLLSKNNYGTLEPQKYDSFSDLAQMALFEELFYGDNTATIKKNNHLTNAQYADLKKIREEQLDIFSMFSTTTNFTYNTATLLWEYTANDLYRALGVSLVNKVTKRKVDVELRMKTELNKAINSNMVSPTFNFPLGYRIADDFKVYPENVTDYFVELLYVRKPKSPKWGYSNVQGNPVYNASDPLTQDFELHESLYEKLVVKIMAYAGVSLRESDIIQVANQEEVNAYQKQQ